MKRDLLLLFVGLLELLQLRVVVVVVVIVSCNWRGTGWRVIGCLVDGPPGCLLDGDICLAGPMRLLPAEHGLLGLDRKGAVLLLVIVSRGVDCLLCWCGRDGGIELGDTNRGRQSLVAEGRKEGRLLLLLLLACR